MAETTIVYNGVLIKNVLTDSIDQVVVPEGTGVNPIYVKVTVSCTGIIHSVSTGFALTIGRSALSTGGDLSSGYNAIIDNLMQPQRSFLMQVGSSPLFDVVPGHVRPGFPNPNAGDVLPIRRTDVNHGPIPEVRVLGITSANTMRVQFKVTMHLPYTDTDGQVPGGAISFRFWISEDIDCDNWTTERTYQGTFRVRHLGHNVLTEIRNNFAFPPLVEGFQRKRIRLAQRSNGLELDFTITDKEVWAVPPPPATSWRGHQTLFTPQPGGALLHSEVSISLQGDKHLPKLALLELCQKVIDTKLHRLDKTLNQASFLMALRARDDFTENKVEMNAVIQLAAPSTMLWNLEKGNFCRSLNIGFPGYAGEFPLYNKEKAAIVFPTACIKGLFLAALQDPAHVSGFPNTNEDARQIYYEALNCPHVVVEPEIPGNADRKISQGHLASAYTMYRLESQTDKTWGEIQLPIGKSSAGSDTAVVLQVHRPTAQLRVRMDAERLMEWPSLPTPEEYVNKLGATFTPLRTSITPAAPILSADHVKTLYHVSADYLFAQNKEADKLPAGLMPYRVAGQDNVYAVPSSVFSDKILFA